EKNLEDVQTDDVTTVTDRLLQKGQPGAAAHSFTAVRTFLKWCVKRRYLQHSPIEALDKPGNSVSRERVLTDEELKAVWRGAGECTQPFSNIVRVLLLTGIRRNEAASIRDAYIKDNGLCLPATLTKNKRPLVRPLCQTSLQLFQKSSSDTCSNALVFPAKGSDAKPFSGFSKGKIILDRKVEKILGRKCEFRLHDLRRSY